jgi:LAO/AO transport system kinase
MGLSVLAPPKTVGVIKYTRTALHATVTDAPHLIDQPDKDTARYHTAGASKVLWMQSPPEDLPLVLSHALQQLEGCDIIIVEGNSPIEFLRPDGVICIVSSGAVPSKPSARKALQIADLIAVAPGGSFPDTAREVPVVHLPDLSHNTESGALHPLVQYMDDILTKKKITALLTERAENGRITCTAARSIAEELGIAYALVGAAANELNIKVKQCELGCF